MTRKFLPAILLVLLAGKSLAQQDPQMTMYMFNHQIFNPGVNGYLGATNVTGAFRSQWVGIDGQPNTFTLALNTPVSLLRGGVGLAFLYDAIGPINTIKFNGSYAFKLELNKDKGTALQIGVAPGLINSSINRDMLRPADPSDPKLQTLGASPTVFNLGAGVFFYRQRQNNVPEKFFIGASVDNITEPVLKYDQALEGTNYTRTIYGTAGYRFDLKENIHLVPSAMFRMAGPFNTLDVNANLHVRPMVFGLGYRVFTGDILAMVGFNPSQSLFMAYSYDYTTNNLRSFTSGSHELLLSYTFPKVFRFYPPDLDGRDYEDFR
ncbi:MAG: type IX secretion system membrane protein PorP/SprF [Bacteroidetes bacterium]|nr:type IX secretion system membrane protein PorP/SprF [Bacteroidota bacterium]